MRVGFIISKSRHRNDSDLTTEIHKLLLPILLHSPAILIWFVSPILFLSLIACFTLRLLVNWWILCFLMALNIYIFRDYIPLMYVFCCKFWSNLCLLGYYELTWVTFDLIMFHGFCFALIFPHWALRVLKKKEIKRSQLKLACD